MDGTGLHNYLYVEAKHAGKTARKIVREGTFGTDVFGTEAEVVEFVLNDADMKAKYVEYLSSV